MKKKGCNAEFAADRYADLRKAYKAAWEGLSDAQRMEPAVNERLAAAAVAMPSERFWVSEERAYWVVLNMLKGRDILAGMRPTKARMFAEICRRVRSLRMAMPDALLPELVAMVVYEPAPEFYMEPANAVYILCRARKERRHA